MILDLTTSFAFSVEPNVIELPCGRNLTRSTSVSYSAFLAEMGYRTVQYSTLRLDSLRYCLFQILPSYLIR